MLSQVSSKEMITQAYECGVTFFIQKPVNGVEVVRVLTNVIDSIQMRRTFNQMQSLFLKDGQPASGSAPVAMPNLQLASEQPEEKPHIRRLQSILQKLGIIGESGSSDIITLVDYMIEQGPESGKFTVSELCSKFSPGNAKIDGAAHPPCRQCGTDQSGEYGHRGLFQRYLPRLCRLNLQL